MNPGDTLRRPHARHAGRLPGRHLRPHHRPARLDDGQQGQRLRAVLFQPKRQDLPRAAVRVPPGVLLGGPARLDLGRAHLQRRRLGRDRPLRVLQRHRPATRRLHQPGGDDPTLDADDQFCLDGAHSARDPDHGLRPRRRRLRRAVVPARLAGTFANPRADRRLHPTPMRFTVPTSERKRALEKVAFETDLPASSAASRATRPECDGADRRALRQPAAGRAVLSHLHAGPARRPVHAPAGRHAHPGHDRTRFGGTSPPSTASSLFVTYANAGFTTDPAGRGLP